MSTEWVFTNNAIGRLNAAISNVATSLTLEFQQGLLFPNPTGGQKAKLVLEDRRNGYIEICNMTAKSGDDITIQRAQEGTTALSWPIQSHVSIRMTAEAYADIWSDTDTNITDIATNVSDIAALDARITALEALDPALEALQDIYPVGSLYFSTNGSMPAAVAALGTWAVFGNGRAIVGVGTADGVTWALGDLKGASTIALATANLPVHTHNAGALATSAAGSHSHNIRNLSNTTSGDRSQAGSGSGSYYRYRLNDGSTETEANHTHSITGATASTGSGTAFSLVQPSIAVSIWKRTA